MSPVKQPTSLVWPPDSWCLTFNICTRDKSRACIKLRTALFSPNNRQKGRWLRAAVSVMD